MREREREQPGRGRKRGGLRILSRLCSVSTEPDMWFRLMSREIMTQTEVRRFSDRRSHPPRCPSKRLFFFFMFIYFEREKENEQGRGRERGKERILGRLHTVFITASCRARSHEL